MKFGYSFWGFTADRKFEGGREVSTPDGNAAYSWSILWEAQRRSWKTYLLQKDRDSEYIYNTYNPFDCFSSVKRLSAWNNVENVYDEFPKLDVLLLEWRFPIPGRNIDVSKDDPNYQPDLDRQLEILNHYKGTNTKIIIWDLDHKLTAKDEWKWKPDAIFETSAQPLELSRKRIRVEPPIVIDELLQFETLPVNRKRKLVYIGSRYERDDVIEEWIKPVSEEYPFQVEFWGNWTREPILTECREMWPYISYNKRVTMSDFREVYGNAVACPLLGKKSYLSSGFITPRPWEALMFGTIPIGLEGHLGVDDYTLFTARDSDDMIDIIDYLSSVDLRERDDIRKQNVEKIRFMDVKNFINEVEKVIHGR